MYSTPVQLIKSFDFKRLFLKFQEKVDGAQGCVHMVGWRVTNIGMKHQRFGRFRL